MVLDLSSDVSIKKLNYLNSNLDIFARSIEYKMNLQEILAPIESVFIWSFGILKAGGNNVNYLLMIIISAALVYWLVKLAGFEKDEVLNR
jgi:hypothetical protein